MWYRLTLALSLMAFSPLCGTADADSGPATVNNCLQCHTTKQSGFNVVHSFAAASCVTCHAGDATAFSEQLAHAGLIAFPGNLANAGQTCGGCHAERVSGVSKNLMHTGHGMVRITRATLDNEGNVDPSATFQALGHSVADSMLRKQCASCHLGQPKTKHELDVTFDRGGGCLACHINHYPEEAHPALTTRVEDGRCFGCHSRSGRISLSYAGLAEVDASAADSTGSEVKLADGRTVEQRSADVHYLAGMSCIDCHTGVGLMGDARGARHQRQAVDIQCGDCHDNDNARITLSEWPSSASGLRKHVPFDIDAETRFLTTEHHGTPLWQVELLDPGARLHTKITGRQLPVPRPDPTRIGHGPQHERLTCAACHSQWAPQCFGCHMEYDAAGEQWDHIEKRKTAGRWSDERWSVNNTLPALGVNDNNRIEPFVPGMIMTLAHPSLEGKKFVRQFAALSPHTSGKSRSCESCHRSSRALGLGEGKLVDTGEGLRFLPRQGMLRDGLPADAWTNIDSSLGGHTPNAGQRPFSAAEIQRILEADITVEDPGAQQ